MLTKKAPLKWSDEDATGADLDVAAGRDDRQQQLPAGWE